MLEKEKQRKTPQRIYQEENKIRIVINEMVNKLTIEKIDKTEAVFLKD